MGPKSILGLTREKRKRVKESKRVRVKSFSFSTVQNCAKYRYICGPV